MNRSPHTYHCFFKTKRMLCMIDTNTDANVSAAYAWMSASDKVTGKVCCSDGRGWQLQTALNNDKLDP